MSHKCVQNNKISRQNRRTKIMSISLFDYKKIFLILSTPQTNQIHFLSE